jgi:hypothetical protein
VLRPRKQPVRQSGPPTKTSYCCHCVWISSLLWVDKFALHVDKPAATLPAREHGSAAASGRSRTYAPRRAYPNR